MDFDVLGGHFRGPGHRFWRSGGYPGPPGIPRGSRVDIYMILEWIWRSFWETILIHVLKKPVQVDFLDVFLGYVFEDCFFDVWG